MGRRGVVGLARGSTSSPRFSLANMRQLIGTVIGNRMLVGNRDTFFPVMISDVITDLSDHPIRYETLLVRVSDTKSPTKELQPAAVVLGTRTLVVFSSLLTTIKHQVRVLGLRIGQCHSTAIALAWAFVALTRALMALPEHCHCRNETCKHGLRMKRLHEYGTYHTYVRIKVIYKYVLYE